MKNCACILYLPVGGGILGGPVPTGWVCKGGGRFPVDVPAESTLCSPSSHSELKSPELNLHK